MHRHGRWSLLSGPGGGQQVPPDPELLYYILRMADAATPAGSASSRPASVIICTSLIQGNNSRIPISYRVGVGVALALRDSFRAGVLLRSNQLNFRLRSTLQKN